jgi:hypothetical protein
MASQDAGSLSQSRAVLKGDSPVSLPPGSAWNTPLPTSTLPKTPAEVETDKDGNFKLHELRVRVLDRDKTLPGQRIIAHFQSEKKGSLESLLSKSGYYHAAFFKDLAYRDSLNHTKVKIDGITVKLEAFPPLDNPTWRSAPHVVCTKIRLLQVPPHLPMAKIEAALRLYLPYYINDSAQFETYVSDRSVRNGNVTLYVEKFVRGTPFRFLRVEGLDVAMQNPLRPSVPEDTPRGFEEFQQLQLQHHSKTLLLKSPSSLEDQLGDATADNEPDAGSDSGSDSGSEGTQQPQTSSKQGGTPSSKKRRRRRRNNNNKKHK